MPALGTTELPRVLADALKDRNPKTFPHLRLSPKAGGDSPSQAAARVERHGAALAGRHRADTQMEQALKRTEERFALAADGADDGWVEWDLRSQEFYCSARWRDFLALAGAAVVARPDVWLDRVHPDDTAALKEALKAHLSGQTPRFQTPASPSTRRRHLSMVRVPRYRGRRGEPQGRHASRDRGPTRTNALAQDGFSNGGLPRSVDEPPQPR